MKFELCLLASYGIAEVLQDGGDNEIVITTKFANDAKDLIQYYRTQCTSRQFVAILNDIEYDLQRFVELSKSELEYQLN